MDCEKSIEMLSDYHDGALDEGWRVEISLHLAGCGPCAGLYGDLDIIIVAANSLSIEQSISFPDEELLWQRLKLADAGVH